MPFDALVTTTSPRTLSEALEDRGIVPVSPEVLATHKRAQLEKFGPSVSYRLQAPPGSVTPRAVCNASRGLIF